MRMVDVPGLSGRSVTIAAAARLADGGAIVAGTVRPRQPRRARPRVVVIRLRHDGLLDTSFGRSGIVTAQLSRGDGRAGSRATAVTVDPARGRSWVGAAVGGKHAGAVLALDGRGRRRAGFGTRAVVRFDGDETAPTAIAYGSGRLAVAATRRPCVGCQVLLLDPASGARGAQAALAPAPGADAARCSGAEVRSLALAGADRLVLGGSGGDACPTRVVARDAALKPIADAAADDSATTGGAPVRTVVAAAGAPLDLCLGVQRAGAVGLVRTSGADLVAAPASQRVRGTLVAVVPLGDRACGALLRRPGKPARVVQASSADDAPAVAETPADLRAGAIYRCKRHVLVVGTRRVGGVDRASVAVTSIVRR